MGNYLTAPNSTKVSRNGSIGRLRYAVCAMQGWRTSMEDSHLVHSFEYLEPHVGPAALFGVFDGHGGSHVAQFVARHFVDELLKLSDFQKGHFDSAFRAVYISLDYLLRQESHQPELEWFSRKEELTGEGPSPFPPGPSSTPAPCPLEPEVSESFIPFKGNKFRTSVRLKSRRLYQKVQNRDRKLRRPASGTQDNKVVESTESLDDRRNTEDYPLERISPKTPSSSSSVAYGSRFLSSFDSIPVSDELPSPKIVTHNQLSNGQITRSGDTAAKHRRRSYDEICRNFQSESTRFQDILEPKVVSPRLHLNKMGAQMRIMSMKAGNSLGGKERSLSDDFELPVRKVTEPENGSDVSPGNRSAPVGIIQSLRAMVNSILKVGGSKSGIVSSQGYAMFTGCTAISVLVTDSRVIVANAGDSRAVLCRGDLALELSKDHKPTLPDEKARIFSAGGWLQMGRVNGNLNLSRALGDLVYKENQALSPDKQIVSPVPDVMYADIQEEDEFLVVGCDGIWESSTSQEIVDFIRKKINTLEPISFILEGLFEELLSPNPNLFEFGCDNMTAILIDLRPDRRKEGEKLALLAGPFQESQSVCRTIEERFPWESNSLNNTSDEVKDQSNKGSFFIYPDSKFKISNGGSFENQSEIPLSPKLVQNKDTDDHQ